MREPYLNEKIANWCGFEEQGSGYWYPLTREFGKLPNFTESMDAILKWVVPKLTDYAIEWHGKDMHRVSIQTIFDGDLFYQCDNKSMSMAFCLALEKYIDGEMK